MAALLKRSRAAPLAAAALSLLVLLAATSPALAAPKPAPSPSTCTDIPFKGVDCKKQTLWGNCSRPEFAGFCDETCGRCASTWKIVPGTESTSSTDGGKSGGTVRSASLAPLESTQGDTLGPDLDGVEASFEQVSETILRVKISSPGRWEVPRSIFRNVVEQPAAPAGGDSLKTPTPAFDVDVAASPFSFAVKRANSAPGPDSTIFDTTGTRLVLKDQYLELSSALPASSRLYGLGESTSTTGLLLPRDGRPHTLWNHDSPAAYPGVNMYGSWPMLLDVRAGGLAHGVLLMNSNGMDVTLSEEGVTWRAIGGVLDFYVFLGPTPNDVVDQLTQVVGRPWLPPYWSLGLMQSKYGYQSIEECETAVDGYREAKIPLETFVSDSQYMDEDQDFTLGKRFPQPRMKAFVDKLHANGQRWVPILDPVIHVRKGYKPYDDGVAANVFLNDQTGHPYVAQLWPGASHLPDFMHPNASSWWQEQLRSVIDEEGLGIDGIWLDMNEVSNYCTGDVCRATTPVLPNNKFVCELQCENGPRALNKTLASPVPPPGIYNPPYAINNGGSESSLGAKTLPSSAVHHGGVFEYNVHNLYAHFQTMATATALQKLRDNKRQFIFTRSSFVGTGAYSAHWTGDTLSSWDDLRASLPMIFQSGIAGIPFVGADICGFMKYASEELCARWAAVGAWYPYSRNHHADGFQEFWRWPRVAAVARKAYSWRYRALPHMYTAFADSRARGCPVARPPLFGWPADPGLAATFEQWTIGDGLLVSPVLRGGRDGTDAYFPAGTWYSMHDYSQVIDSRSGGKTVTLLSGVDDDAPLHIAGGAVVPLGGDAAAMTTGEAAAAPLVVVAALPRPGSGSWVRCRGGREGLKVQGPDPAGVARASGSMFLDDREAAEEEGPGARPIERRGRRIAFDLEVVDGSSGGDDASSSPATPFTGNLTLSWPEGDAGDDGSACAPGPEAQKWPRLHSFHVLGLGALRAADVKVSVVPEGSSSSPPVAVVPKLVSYDAKTAVLKVSGLGVDLRCGHSVVVSFVGASAAGVSTSVADVSRRFPLPFDPRCDCDDVAPTPDFTCPEQAKYGKCQDGFMYGYCKKSCGTCKCDVETGAGAVVVPSDVAAANATQFSVGR